MKLSKGELCEYFNGWLPGKVWLWCGRLEVSNPIYRSPVALLPAVYTILTSDIYNFLENIITPEVSTTTLSPVFFFSFRYRKLGWGKKIGFCILACNTVFRAPKLSAGARMRVVVLIRNSSFDIIKSSAQQLLSQTPDGSKAKVRIFLGMDTTVQL